MTSAQVEEMKREIRLAQEKDVRSLVYALELPSNQGGDLCVDQLEEVYSEFAKLNPVALSGQSEQLIKNWFERQKNEIIAEKLRMVVEAANKKNFPTVIAANSKSVFPEEDAFFVPSPCSFSCFCNLWQRQTYNFVVRELYFHRGRF